VFRLPFLIRSIFSFALALFLFLSSRPFPFPANILNCPFIKNSTRDTSSFTVYPKAGKFAALWN
jgi:hypothetical protein